MSFIFSQALVEASSPDSCLDIEQSAPSSGNPMPRPCLWHDRTMEPSRLSRFGITCSPLTGDRGVELLTWWREVSRVKTFPSPAQEPESTVSEADSGEKWPASLARYDRDTSSWKTAQLSLLGDSEPSSVTWPRSGLMLDGQCWELPTLERRTSESASGFWQTPVADDAVNRQAGKWNSRGEPKLSAQVLLPTPTRDSKREKFWPTPTVCGNHNRKGASATSGDGLATVVAQRTWPTATATAYKGWSPNHNRANTDDRLDYTVEREAFQPGQQTPPMRLSPDWTEWLMGWPIGHTALKPLATDKFREWRRQHGECSMSGVVDPNRPRESAQIQHPRHLRGPLLGTMIDK